MCDSGGGGGGGGVGLKRCPRKEVVGTDTAGVATH